MLYNADCLDVLKTMEDETINLVYLDPPFFTQKNHKLSSSDGIQYEFSDIWESRAEYIQYIKERIIELWRVLKSDGNLFLHCDTSASHYLRVILDEVFGENFFRSEIIWSYKRWSNAKKGLLSAHQTILWYSKTEKYKYHILYGEYSPTTNIDQILQERERNSIGKAIYKRDKNGEIINGKEKRGVPISDVWEIPFLNPKAKERTGYPTQKPIELLERIIEISTDENDVVLDPFCGSGTTMVSAKLLNRNFIGIDINPEAIKLSQLRLEKPYKTSSHLLRVGADAYKTKTEDELAILKQFDCDIVQRNKGIDAFLRRHYSGAPVAIRLQRENETFEDAVALLDTAGRKKKCSLTVLIAYESEKKNVPANMLVLTRHNIMLESLIWELENRSKRA